MLQSHWTIRVDPKQETTICQSNTQPSWPSTPHSHFPNCMDWTWVVSDIQKLYYTLNVWTCWECAGTTTSWWERAPNSSCSCSENPMERAGR
jgi:hypothetical protein